MKKFKFKLDPLLRYRSFQEHQKKLEVAAARHDVMACDARIDEIIISAKKTVDTLDKAISDGIDAGRLELFKHYLSGLSILKENEEKRRIQLITVLTRKQRELTEKTIAKKVVENLKSRRKEDYYREAQKIEQKTLDDMVILRASRTVRE